jgi:hypothetical protein
MSKKKAHIKQSYSKPKLTELGSAKELIKAEFSELFDTKNSDAAVDMFNANAS